MSDTQTSKGVKYDEGKIPLSLLPKPALLEVAKVLAFGASKYGPYNWAKGMDWSRLISAASRHLWAFENGENVDPETGLSHLSHASCCLLFLLTYQLFGLGKDDRHSFRKVVDLEYDDWKLHFDHDARTARWICAGTSKDSGEQSVAGQVAKSTRAKRSKTRPRPRSKQTRSRKAPRK